MSVSIQALIARLPGAEEGTSYGTPAFKVNGKLFARFHQKEDAVVLFLDSLEERDAYIAADPDTYYITDHYLDYAAVLVRPSVDDQAFFELLEQAWRRVARPSDLAAYESLH